MNHSAEIAALKRRIAALEARLNPSVRAPEPEHLGPARDGQGNVIVRPDLPSYEERMAEHGANERRHADQVWKDQTEGLPAGQFRDACGIVRDISSGRQVATAALEHAEVREVMKEQGAAPRFVGGASSPQRKR